MAKTIKFNLIMDEKAVRNIEGLQDNFCIEDLLKYYKNGLLLRWLTVREYQEEAEQVKKIAATDDREIIRALANIFKMEVKDKEIDEATKLLEYLEEERKKSEEYRKIIGDKEAVLQKYHEEYVSLLKKMETDKDDMTALKNDARNLAENYERLFALDRFEVYQKFCKEMPKVILSILSIDELRKYWDEKRTITDNLKNKFLTETNKYAEIFGDRLRTENRCTDGYWSDIAQPNVELIVLHIENNTIVRNADDEQYFKQELKPDDVNGKFLKFHGLKYKCDDQAKTLYYVEV